ncbi:hypothetical protein HK103_000398 [Boothiomyces macroporosus]|uniref:FH2 domain-containing protein n=1 Tax=Boothiomyces macroporosus TaxID=261099 RepID=A0AAD5Y167_9FUNG|nr:hypothetical protein HK103_000398 [Boothiomyces macroporosus]
MMINRRPPGMGGPPPGMGPPPPPGMGFAAPAAPAVPSKPLNLSSKPLKSFNWAKIAPLKVKDTVWEDIDDAEIHAKLKKGVYNEFEDMFAAKETKVVETPTEKVDLDIMLKAIKLDPTSIKKAILTVDLKILPNFVLTELLKLIPTDEELSAVKQYANEIQNLASAERFMYEISEITKYELKLKAMYFKGSFAEYQEDAESMITNLGAACSDVKNSKKFKELLKMIDTKSTVQNRKHTLLHYLTELLEKEFPDVLGFQDELSHVEEGSKIGIPAIRTALVTIRDNLKALKGLLDSMEEEAKAKGIDKKPSSGSTFSNASASSTVLTNKFRDVMQSFYEECEKIYENLDTKFKTTEKEFESAVLLYGEEPKNMTPEEFFGIFAKFTQAFIAAKIDNETAIAKELQEKKREEAKKDQEEKMRKKKEDAQSPTKGPPTEKEGGLDDLISSIRTGKAFGNSDAGSGRQRRMKESFSNRKPEEGRESSALKEKSFQIQDQGAVGRLRRQDPADKINSKFELKKNPDLNKKVAMDGLKHVPNHPSDKDKGESPMVKLRATGINRETPTDIKNRFETAGKS